MQVESGVLCSHDATGRHTYFKNKFLQVQILLRTFLDNIMNNFEDRKNTEKQLLYNELEINYINLLSHRRGWIPLRVDEEMSITTEDNKIYLIKRIK